jgi:predicted permease
LGRYFRHSDNPLPRGQFFRQTLFDPKNLPMLAVIVGLGLNLSGVSRPVFCGWVLPPLVYVGTLISGFAAGLLYRHTMVKKYFRENLFSFIYRSTVYPGLFAFMAFVCHLSPLDTRILILFGLVPCAIFANLVADFFHLDTDLTSSLFLVSMVLFLVLVLPVYTFFAVF